MPSFRTFGFGCIVLLLAVGICVAEESAMWQVEAAQEQIKSALLKTKTIRDQAYELSRLAWPDEGVTRPLVSSLARQHLVTYGDRALLALRRRVHEVDPRFAADIASALLETRRVVSSGFPPEYLPALDDIIWNGSPEAKRLTMLELGRQQFRPGLLPAIDASYEHPELTCTVIRAMRHFKDDRARHFLGERLQDPAIACREAAADALATIGGRALEVLRDAALDEDETTRGIAIDALVPVSRVDDLTVLYEYLGQFSEDEPVRVEQVTERALTLEQILQSQQERDAATNEGNF